MLEERIRLLKRELIEYATLVENMLVKVVKGLLEKEKDYLLEIIEKDEPEADQYEFNLDE